MAVKHGKGTTALLDGINLSPYLHSAGMAIAASAPDTSTFGNDWATALGGRLSADMSIEGYYDPGLVALNESLSVEGRVYTFCPGAGAAVGDAARLFQLDTTEYGESDEFDGIIGFSWAGIATDAVALGTMIHPHAEDTNTTTGSAIDQGAATSTGWSGNLHVTLVDGGSWVVTVEDSADGSSGWATIATFTAKTAAGAQRLESAAATTTARRWVRVVATRTGGSAGQGITYALAFARSRE